MDIAGKDNSTESLFMRELKRRGLSSSEAGNRCCALIGGCVSTQARDVVLVPVDCMPQLDGDLADTLRKAWILQLSHKGEHR